MTGAIERELRVARGLASCLGDEAALDEADAELRALRARLAEAMRLLTEVLPQEMGGTPDLFGPADGWDTWEERAAAWLAGGEP